MAKCLLTIGYSTQDETSPGVWIPTIVEKTYKADTVKTFDSTVSGSDKANSDLNFSMSFSMLADTYAIDNLATMLYVIFMGRKYKIVSVSFDYPRIKITMGGVYNE